MGLEQTAPVFISCISSYMLVCGSGLFAAIATRGIAAQKDETADNDDNSDPYSAIPKKKQYDGETF